MLLVKGQKKNILCPDEKHVSEGHIIKTMQDFAMSLCNQDLPIKHS